MLQETIINEDSDIITLTPTICVRWANAPNLPKLVRECFVYLRDLFLSCRIRSHKRKLKTDLVQSDHIFDEVRRYQQSRYLDESV